VRTGGDSVRSALVLGACLALSACSATPAPPPKAATAPAPARPAAMAAGPQIPAAFASVIAPAEPPPMAALARRLAMVIDGAKPQVTPFSIDLSTLPRTEMHAPLDAKQVAKLDRSKLVEDADLTVKPADGYARQYMLSFGFKDPSKVSFAHVRVTSTYGVNEGWFGEGYNSAINTYMTCGQSAELVPIHWETVKMEKDQVTYAVSDGVLDRQTCRVLAVRKSVAVAKPLLPKGILYGFRACESGCTEGDDLTLLFPRAAASAAGALGGGADRASGSFSMVSFPIQRGGGGAFIARVMRRDVVAWQLRAADLKEPDKALAISSDAARVGAMFLSSFEIGVEVSQGHDDSAPIAIAYMDIDPAALPPPPAAAPQTPAPVKTSAVQGTFDGRLGFDIDPLSDRR
jgi:hypothetical protein